MAEKKLSYFQWHVFEVESDEDWRAMTYEERGIFITMLDLAWINQGLSANLGDIASVLKLSMKNFMSCWKRIGKKFEIRGDRYVNPRQEIERTKALNKSVNNKGSAEARWGKDNHANAMRTHMRTHSERNANGMPRASLSLSGSSSKELLEQEITEFSDWVEIVVRAHPNKREIWLGRKALVERFASDTEARQVFDAHHPWWVGCEAWTDKNGAFALKLWEFVESGAWQDPPPGVVLKAWNVLPEPAVYDPETEEWTENDQRWLEEFPDHPGAQAAREKRQRVLARKGKL